MIVGFENILCQDDSAGDVSADSGRHSTDWRLVTLINGQH